MLLRHRVDPVLEVGLDLVLVPGVGVDRVPAEHRRLLAQQDVLDEAAEDLVGQEQVSARRSGRRSSTTTVPWISCCWPGHSTFFSSPHDSLDEAEAPAAERWRAAPSLRGWARRPGATAAAAADRVRSSRRPGSRVLGGAAGAALGTGLAGHRSSGSPGAQCGGRTQRQYFLNSIRSGEFRFDFSVW